MFTRLNKIRSVVSSIIDKVGASVKKEEKMSVPSLGIHTEAFDEWLSLKRRNASCVIPWMAMIAFEDSMIGLTTILMMVYVEDALL